MKTTLDHKYLQIATTLETLINDEVLRIGDKLPSVRTLADEYNISMGTAFQAYYHLEGKGLVESRPKSGYYVRFNRKRFPALPGNAKPDVRSHSVTVKDMIAEIYSDIASPIRYNFALGVPDVSLLPAAKLNKSMVHALRLQRTTASRTKAPPAIPNCEKGLPASPSTGAARWLPKMLL